MSEVIVLSDSNESNDEPENVQNRKKTKHLLDNFDSSDFEFPAVQFNTGNDEDNVIELQNVDNLISSPILNTYASISRKHDEYIVANVNSSRRNVKKSLHNVVNSSDSAKDSDDENKNVEKGKAGRNARKKNRTQLTEERLKRKEQLKREKALKAIAAKKLKDIRPGECMKFMEVVLDKGIKDIASITDIISIIVDASCKYSINTESLIPNSITWKRSIENSYVNEANEICSVTDVEKIMQILIIWNWDEAVTKIADNIFCATISSIKCLVPDYKMILVIYGIEDYFAARKPGKSTNKNAKAKAQKNCNENNLEFKALPEISRRQLESCLNEIQIVANCSSRLINSSQELALMVHQCTKAISEIPYKVEKNKNLTNKFDWYVMGDNRNTVKVDKDGNGLKRLWQQQLCQFNLVSLEIAEAICSVYPSPANLIEAYLNCTRNDGINLLKDIPIRRAAGPLTAVRKVGPELSKKVYLMFMSEDGETILN